MANIFTPLNFARIFASLEVCTGTFAVVAPLAFTRFFGVPSATPETSKLATGLGGRNLGWAFSILILSATDGHEKAIGTMLAGYTLAGLADTWICYQHGDGALQHIVATVMLGAVALWVFNS